MSELQSRCAAAMDLLALEAAGGRGEAGDRAAVLHDLLADLAGELARTHDALDDAREMNATLWRAAHSPEGSSRRHRRKSA